MPKVGNNIEAINSIVCENVERFEENLENDYEVNESILSDYGNDNLIPQLDGINETTHVNVTHEKTNPQLDGNISTTSVTKISQRN